MIWLSSDQHLGHAGIIEMCGRPFQNVQEMNNTIIQNINAVVKPNDTLYLLGDVCHKATVEEGNGLFQKIKCKNIYLIKGNHDKGWEPSLFQEVCDYKEIHAGYKGKNHRIVMSHYPFMSWNKSHHGSLMLHGHVHSKPEYNLQMKQEGIRRYDVGVDANYYYPVSLQQILSFMGLE